MESKPSKLRILCMHGFNNNKETFEFMTSSFREKYAHLADFVFAEGPYIINEERTPPEAALISRGFKGPFRAWFSFINCVLEEINSDDDVPTSLQYGTAEEEQHENPNDEFKTYRGAEEIAKVVLTAIKKYGQIDGVVGFS